MRKPYLYLLISLHVARLRRVYFFLGLLGIVLGVAFYTVFIEVPKNFPIGELITIPKGVSAQNIASILHQKHVIASPKVFVTTTEFFFIPEKLQAGDYIFEKKLSTFSIARRIILGEHGLTPVTVRFTEGSTVREIAQTLQEKFPHIDPVKFQALANPFEGYLFPDTYSFLPNVSEEEIIAAMRLQFDKKIETIKPEIEAFGKPLKDIVTMASLIEKEARTLKSKQGVSGVLWNRIERGMPLQVDAVFGYIYGKDTFSPRFSDLEVDSPYNTYKNEGLPPGPISNPGIDSLRAAVTPTPSPYLFYLTGKDGRMHYAKTFEQHVRNRKRFLD